MWTAVMYRFNGIKELVLFQGDIENAPVTILEERNGTVKAVYPVSSHRDVYTSLADLADALLSTVVKVTRLDNIGG